MNKNGKWNAARRISIIIMDILVLDVSIYLNSLLKFQEEVPARDLGTFQHSAIFISIIFIALNISLGVYVFYNRMISDIVFIIVIGQVLITLEVMVVIFVRCWFASPCSVIVLSFILDTILPSVYRIVVYKLYLGANRNKKVLIVGLEEDVAPTTRNFQSKKNNKHKVEVVVIDNCYENTRKLVDDIDTVYLASKISEDEKINIYQLMTKKEKRLPSNITLEDLAVVSPSIMNFKGESITEASGFKIQPEYELFKHPFDIVALLISLILASSFMLITATLTKAISPGSIIYKQVRVTKNQKESPTYKFRSMSVTAGTKLGSVLVKSDDVCVTLVGKLVCAARFDELPQIFNILKGGMSIARPCPERPSLVDQFNEENPYYYLRRNAHAGTTGYAQICGECVPSCNSKLRFDLLYIEKYSLLLGLKILF